MATQFAGVTLRAPITFQTAPASSSSATREIPNVTLPANTKVEASATTRDGYLVTVPGQAPKEVSKAAGIAIIDAVDGRHSAGEATDAAQLHAAKTVTLHQDVVAELG